MYGFSLLHGNAQTALNNPFTLVITESKAKKYFGKTDVLGQTLSIESFSGTSHDFVITGVLKRPPENTVLHLNPDNRNEFYLSESSLNYFGRNMETWANLYIVSCIELQKGVEPKDLEKPMRKLIRNNASAQVSESLTPRLVLLKDYYLNSNNGLVKKMLYTLSCIALFILLMAIVNFINISISKSATRIREIGVRKVMGGLRQQLLQQFLVESVILVSFATGFALVIYEFTRNFFSSLLHFPCTLYFVHLLFHC